MKQEVSGSNQVGWEELASGIEACKRISHQDRRQSISCDAEKEWSTPPSFSEVQHLYGRQGFTKLFLQRQNLGGSLSSLLARDVKIYHHIKLVLRSYAEN